MELAGMVDGLLKAVSSKRYLARQERLAKAEFLRNYAAAKPDPLKGAWGLGAWADRDVNTLIANASPILRARVRHLVRNFPIFSRVVEVATNLTVGTGIGIQCRIRKPDGSLDEDLNSLVEDEWEEFCEGVDVNGTLSMGELQRLARRQEYECGEAFGVLVDDREQRPVPMYVQLIEPDWLAGSSYLAADRGQDTMVIDGVEVKKPSGKVLGFWLEDADLSGDGQQIAGLAQRAGLGARRVEAADALHPFAVHRPGQLRGVSPLVPAVLAAHDIGEYLGAEVEGAANAARYLLTHNVNNPAQRIGATTQAYVNPNGEKKDNVRIQEIARNIAVVGKPGEEFKLLKSERPGSQFEPTVNFISRLICIVGGVSYELGTGDYSRVSWSTINNIRADLVQQSRPDQLRFARHFIGPIYGRWLDRIHQTPGAKLRLPYYWQRRRYYHRAIKYQFPTLEALDQLRQSRSTLDKLGAGILDPIEELAKNGRDPRTVLRNIEQFKKWADECGVNLSWGKKPVKNNPAAIIGESDA
jgi:lambda family phage portal protein